jgi:hypothetical protein
MAVGSKFGVVKELNIAMELGINNERDYFLFY